jgi:hypothetical protein
MERLLDSIFDGLKSLEGRAIPKGWSAALAAGSVLFIAIAITVIAFLLV